MATVRLSLAFVSVQAAKPSKSFGTLAYPPLKNNQAEILLRAAMPTLPKGSVITDARVWIAQHNAAWPGTNTIALRRNLVSWISTATWNNRPNVAATPTGSQTKTNAPAFTWWDVAVTTDVQKFYSRLLKNWGWTLRTNDNTGTFFRGTKAPTLQPYLEIQYEPPVKTPTQLNPHEGAVSVAKPVLTFNVSDNTTAIQVQIDPMMNGTTPAFDSGEVASVAGYLDLNDTAYAGLANGATTYWRARAKGALGFSAWSAWAEFSRQDFGALTITSPIGTASDTTPPVTWTYAGTQTSYRARLLSGQTVLRDSGRVAGTDTSYTPTPLVGDYFGKPLTYEVFVWDDVTRDATPGAPAYVLASSTFTATFSTAVAPVADLAFTSVDGSPGLVLTGTRAAGIPDELAIFHDGDLVARIPGADAFYSPTEFAFIDWYARMGRETTIQVVAVVNGDHAAASPTVTVTPSCRGIWLVDPDTDKAIVLFGDDAGTWNSNEVATEHRAVDGRLVRRRLANPPASGSLTGNILAVPGANPDGILANFETFAGNDAGTEYRLILGQTNRPVIAGRFLAYPTPLEGREIFGVGSFDWWGI